MKPSIPKGMRDFGSAEVLKRNFIFNTIQKVFQKFGYSPIETPTMENLSTLTGKYGEEGDQLLFKVLNSGDYLSKTDLSTKPNPDSKSFSFQISEKALRYDLTVPFARFVVMHQNEITFPFKRYQIQPVWRADRPQRGRYREFYQCDADVVGSDSLINEAEFICIYVEALSNLGLKDFTVKLNNRKILAGLAEHISMSEKMMDMTIAIDKLDKIGFEGVAKELTDRGFSEHQIAQVKTFLSLEGDSFQKLQALEKLFAGNEMGLKGIAEMQEVLQTYKLLSSDAAFVELDFTLARGLNYYTGTIFEVKSNEVQMGSIGGGGRYDDLTGMFGLKGLSGVGISFGADRIYDVMEELKLFKDAQRYSTKVLIVNFGEEVKEYALKILSTLRKNEINSEYYPSNVKLQKQMKYGNDKQVPFVLLIGEEEMKNNTITLKQMLSGEQHSFSMEEIIKFVQSNS